MTRELPQLIQGGMGIAVSDWRLARAVSAAGQLGVVSGTAIDAVLARRLQLGDPGGEVRRALAAFPVPEAAQGILDRYFVAGGKDPDDRFKQSPMKRDRPSRKLAELIVAANFVEVYLAKEGHDGPVGINYLEKLQAPTLPSLYGAMLAGVDYVLMGAGIPRSIPAILDRLAAGLPVEMRLDVKEADKGKEFLTRFDPADVMGDEVPTLPRPDFLAIVSSHVLATMLARKIEVPVDGFVVEAPTAGGHNAPPRGKLQLTEHGEPIYGERDVPDFSAISELGLPFWLAGGYAEPEQVRAAIDLGAAGVQVGTAFAYCEESGFEEGTKQHVLDLSRRGRAEVFTDPVASPSGFPFKVVQLDDTLSDAVVYEKRNRICDLGYLRTAYQKDDGEVGWRCPAEPVADFIAKGGKEEEASGRKCLCNALMVNIGLGQIQRDGSPELPLITSGDDVADVARFLPAGADTYTAADVINYLLADA
jgi:nitronate monooxygenase